MLAEAQHEVAPAGPQHCGETRRPRGALIVVECVEEARVDDRSEAAAEIGKAERVADAEVDRKTTLIGFGSCPLDRRRHEVDTHHLMPA